MIDSLVEILIEILIEDKDSLISNNTQHTVVDLCLSNNMMKI